MSESSPLPTVDPELTALEAALSAQYDIVRPLGRGGMGIVYLARERLLDRLVAIKVLRSDRDSVDSQERFLREARTAAKLTHPHIVPLLSFGQSGNTVFYVMGYVDGESLESLLRRESRLSSDESMRIHGELADALDYAHRNGVVHRDIKPDNVLIERGTGRAVLTDFGIAKLQTAGALTATGVVVGTPHYMSPEQAAGDRAVDGRSDIYSLGVVGYRMAAGRLPFAGESYQEIIAAHVTRAPVSLESAAPDAAVALTTAVMRCLRKDPAERWPTAALLRSAIGVPGDESFVMPEGLEHMPSLAPRLAAVLWAADTILFGIAAGTRDLFPVKFAVAVTVLLPAMLIPSFVMARKSGISRRRALQILFAAPPKWASWWPARFRRPGDVWPRLPAVVRRARVALTWVSGVVFGGFPFVVPFLISGLVSPDHYKDMVNEAIIAATFVPMLVVVAIAGLRMKRLASSRGLQPFAASKLVAEPTWGSAFWSRPDIAPLLEKHSRTPRNTEAAVPAMPRMLAEIDELMTDLARIDQKLAADVRAAARELGRSIERVERELADVAANIDPAESARLAERLAQLGEARDDDGQAKLQMRHVLSQQLALMTDLQQRKVAFEERLERARERLRMLWLQLQNVKAQHALESADGAEITGRIRALCAEIGYVTAARDELSALTNRQTR